MRQRIILREELRKVNGVLSTRLGTLNQIASGTCQYKGTRRIYHIVLKDPNPYKPEPMLRNIGQQVKQILQADEVYHLGMQIA